jgi:endoplasmic reticulum protein 29
MFKIFALVICLTTLGFAGATNNCKGCIALDTLTFDKMLKRFRVSLVKFDVAFPYGDKQEEV